MARYIGSVCRLCLRCADKLMLKGGRCYTPKCAVEKRRKPTTRRRRISDRGLQLIEKQKARYSYGMMERPFRQLFDRSANQPGITGDNLQVFLERRLDNVIYRSGFADSRSQARQLVNQGHIVVNGHITNIPSYLVREGDTISFKEGSAKTEYYKQLVESVKGKSVAGWLSLDREKLVSKVSSLPVPDEIEAKFDAKAIVEYYSR
ncbi:MAG: 30S ribosomal protein S4 [Chloroflexi bacterium]|nr:30S ribosomal protein S4 [Chloroflexota bacterium]